MIIYTMNQQTNSATETYKNFLSNNLANLFPKTDNPNPMEYAGEGFYFQMDVGYPRVERDYYPQMRQRSSWNPYGLLDKYEPEQPSTSGLMKFLKKMLGITTKSDYDFEYAGVPVKVFDNHIQVGNNILPYGTYIPSRRTNNKVVNNIIQLINNYYYV